MRSASWISSAPARTNAVQTAVSACFERIDTLCSVTSPATAPATSSVAGGAPVAFDAVIGRSVALAAFDVELGVAVVEDLRTEAVCRLDRHIDIRCGDGAPHVDREFAAGGRQREQQAGDELRRDRTVDLDRRAVQRAADVEREEPVAVAHLDAQLPERGDHHRHRAAQQRPIALDAKRNARKGCDRREQPGRKTRFAHVERAPARGQTAPYFQCMRVDDRDVGTQRFDAAHGRAGVVAQFDVTQCGFSLCQKRRREGALRVTFRAGGSKLSLYLPRRDGSIHRVVRSGLTIRSLYVFVRRRVGLLVRSFGIGFRNGALRFGALLP